MEEDNQDLYEELLFLAVSQLERGDHIDSIELTLRQKCDDIVLITVVLKESRNIHYAALRKQGFRLILIGCITGMCGFLVTLFNFNTSRSIDFAMYGLTTAGLLIVFWDCLKYSGNSNQLLV